MQNCSVNPTTRHQTQILTLSFLQGLFGWRKARPDWRYCFWLALFESLASGLSVDAFEMASCLRSGKAFKRLTDCPDGPIVKQCRFKLSDTVDKDEEGDSIQMDYKDVSGLSLEFDPEEQIKPPIRSLLGPMLTGTSVVPSNRRNCVYSSLEESSAEIAPTNGHSDESDKENINFELHSTAPIFVIHNTHGQQYPVNPLEDYDRDLCKSLTDWLAEHTKLQEEYAQSTLTVRPQADHCGEPNNQTVDLPESGQVLSPSPPTIASPNQPRQLIDRSPTLSVDSVSLQSPSSDASHSIMSLVAPNEMNRSPTLPLLDQRLLSSDIDFNPLVVDMSASLTESTSPEKDNSSPVDSVQTEVLLPIPSSSETIQTFREHLLVSDNQIDHSVGADVELIEPNTDNRNVPILPLAAPFPLLPVVMPPIYGGDQGRYHIVKEVMRVFNEKLVCCASSCNPGDYKQSVVKFLLANKDVKENVKWLKRRVQITISGNGFFSFRSAWLNDENEARIDVRVKVFDYLTELKATIITCKQTIAKLWSEAAAATTSVSATDVINKAFPIIKTKHSTMFKHDPKDSRIFLNNVREYTNKCLAVNIQHLLSFLYSIPIVY